MLINNILKITVCLLLVSMCNVSYTQSLARTERLERPKRYHSQRYFNEYVGTKDLNGKIDHPQKVKEKKSRILNQLEKTIDQIRIKPLRIGLVFHILYTDDVEQAKAAIDAQLVALNRDFSEPSIPRDHPNDPNGIYAQLAANPMIEFYLTNIGGSDLSEPGIARIKGTTKKWKTYDEMKTDATVGSSPVQQKKYINIWICDLDDSIESYATSPFQDDDFDGVVIDIDDFLIDGDINQGKSLTHLLGNYFGLLDLFNQYEYCGDDGVSDTPIHNAPSRGNPKGKHFTLCPTENLAACMTMNFMDSTSDAAQYMFTNGQVRRMHAMIEIAYPSLSKK